MPRDNSGRFLKGTPRPPNSGRGKGTPNKVTKEVKELLAEVVQYGAENAQEWLVKTAQHSPARALAILDKLAEFTMPKLSRRELVGDGEGFSVTVKKYVNAPDRPPDEPAKPPEEEEL